MSNTPINLNDDFGLDERPSRRKRGVKNNQASLRESRLHIMLTKGLPDLVKEDGMLDVRRLADHLGISFQAVYKFFQRDHVPSKRIPIIVALSKSQKTGGANFKPLARDDLWDLLPK